MLFILLTIVLSLFVAHEASAGIIIKSPAYLGLQRGLVGCWSFDGSYAKVPDCSGNNNTGTLTGGPTKAIGKIGQALSFDGVDDNVQVRDAGVSIPALAFGTGPFAVSFWMKVASTEDLDILISGRRTFGWHFQDKTTFLRFFISDSVGSDTLDSATNPFNNTWHHIVGLRDGTNLRMYIDNVAQTPVTDNLRNTDEAPLPGLRFGATGAASPSDFHGGLIDEVRIYNRALSASEIARLYRIGLGSTANRGASASPLDKGLVGHWTFDGPDISGTRAKDRSGNNNHGTLTNGPIQAIGRIGQALSFDNINDYVVIPDDSSLRLTDFTISLWVKPRSQSGAGGHDVYIAKRTVVSTMDWGFVYSLSAFELLFWMGESGASNVFGSLNYSPSLNAWHHVLVTKRGTNYSLYAEGIFLGSEVNATTWTESDNIEIGATDSGSTQVFDGLIDDVRIYNRALSADEIRNLYQETQSKFNVSKTDSLLKGLVGYWTFDGADTHSSGITDDKSGNGNRGTLTNGPTRAIGRIGQALKFDGSNDFVDMGDPASGVLDFTTGNFSISAWAYTPVKDTTATTHSIAGKWVYSATLNGYVLLTESGSYGIQLGNDGDPCQVTWSNSFTTVLLTAATWEHVVANVNRTGSVIMYVNGVQKGSFDISAESSCDLSNSNSFKVGERGSDNRFNGSIDEVRIYNRLLLPAEITKLYNMGR